MKLPAIPFLTKPVASEYFLALIFETNKVGTILFKEQEKSLEVLSSTEISVDLDTLSSEQLIVACDKVISKIESDLPEDANLEKTIFVVPHTWVDAGRITPEKLSQLKKISQELALTPMGFIVSIEAVIAYLQKKNGAPVNGIFVELAKNTISVFIVRGSNVIDFKSGHAGVNVETSVEDLLSKVTKLDVLPPKIYLLHNKEAEAISQKFLSHHWTKELSFMHLPQVSILDKNSESEAIINGVSTQLDVKVTGEIGESIEVADDEEEELIDEGDEFGFAMDEDIADEVSKEKVDESEKDTNVVIDDFEFKADKESDGAVAKHNQEGDESAEAEYEEDIVEKGSKSRGIKGMGSYVATLFTPNTIFSLASNVKNVRKFLIPFIAFVVVVVLLISYYSFFLKVKVVISTDQRSFSENALDITLTTDGESSFEDGILRVKTIQELVDGEQSQETTGSRDTGEEATGEVTIFNKTESPKQLSSGTTITSSNNLEFTLDDAVSIASTSSFSTSFSNSKVKVTASNFGKEYNLPSQTNFTVEGSSASDIFARNDQAFSGGSKEEIRVVSRSDIETLEETLVERLLEKAMSQAEENLSGDEALIPVYINYEFEEREFDRDVNEQANSVKLVGAILYTLGSYNKDELLDFVSSSEEVDVPEDFALSDSDSSVNISDIVQDDDQISAKLSFKAVFKPQLDEESIPQLVAGKGTEDAISKLQEVQGVSNVVIEYQNSIPFLPKIIPLNKNNITLEFESE